MGGWYDDDDDGMTSGEFWRDYSWIIWVVVCVVILVPIITNIIVIFVTLLINLLGRCLEIEIKYFLESSSTSTSMLI